MKALLALLLLAGCLRAPARTVAYDLHIAETTATYSGKTAPALTFTGSLPGPTLRFTEGDWARITVHNDLPRDATSTHWHGLLLPNAQDGVPEVTTPPILPGTSHTFEFPLRQSGTYWYHSHTHFQEQQGLYGAIVIQPRGRLAPPADREHVLLLSDWTKHDPHQIYRNLLRGSDWYSVKKGTLPSLFGAWKAGATREFCNGERANMKAMDLSDVAYDAFLINGQPTSTLAARPGERLRLRLINGSASTYFYLTSSTGPLTLVAADGHPVKPVSLPRLLIAIGETYDALITVPADGQFEIRATSQDGSGHASAFLGSGPLRPASDPPLPDLYRMDQMLQAALDDDPAAPPSPRPAAPYPLLQALQPTTLPTGAPIREIPLHLTGAMDRYRWSFNGKTTSEESLIPVAKGEILRLQLVNDTMMHHPIHLHGFFFRLLNQHGARSPLKHTVDLPPMGRHTIEFQANASGDWMFHCHLLYHMMAGMGRVVAVRDAPAPTETSLPSAPPSHTSHTSPPSHPSHTHGLSLGPPSHGAQQAAASGVNLGEHGHEMISLWGTASVQSHLSEGLLTLRRARHDLLLTWEAGWQGTDATEYQVDATWEPYLGPQARAFGGARLERTDDDGRQLLALAGLRYRLPFFLWSTLSLDSAANVRLELAKSLQLTTRLSAFAALQYDAATAWTYDLGLEYTLSPALSLATQFSSDYGFGGGLRLRF